MTPGLTPLTQADQPRFGAIRVAPDQVVYCGTAAEAFDDAFGGAEGMMDLHGILLDDVPVGLFKIDRDYRRTIPIAAAQAIGLRAFMIERSAQGRGIARAALRALGPYLARHYPKAASVDLTVNHRNAAAIACYLKGGFRDTGQDWAKGQAGPQDLLRMGLR